MLTSQIIPSGLAFSVALQGIVIKKYVYVKRKMCVVIFLIGMKKYYYVK